MPARLRAHGFFSRQVEWLRVVSYTRAAEKIGAEFGDWRTSTASVRQKAAVFLDRQAGFFVPPAANGRINDVTVRGPMECQPGAAAARENPASRPYNVTGLTGRRIGNFRPPERTEAITE
ncbi:MAG: hypothetical protein JO096_05835 [Alphaproteobacteria bacterium]|nr:hypothetical protein [Alphaproteobacteria bacterium]